MSTIETTHVRLRKHGDMVFADRSFFGRDGQWYEVDAETAERWKRAQSDWLGAQAEMRHWFKHAVPISDPRRV